jgi:outer membrane receptor protein involved in Fe transport
VAASHGALTLQTSVAARYSELIYRPDVTGEVLFNGQAQNAFKNDLALSGQMDGVWRVSHAHTIRFGFYLQHDHSISRTGTWAVPVDDDGTQIGGLTQITDNTASNAFTGSVYAQDEWKLVDTLTLNYGGRFDYYSAYRSENQFSPREHGVAAGREIDLPHRLCALFLAAPLNWWGRPASPNWPGPARPRPQPTTPRPLPSASTISTLAMSRSWAGALPWGSTAITASRPI